MNDAQEMVLKMHAGGIPESFNGFVFSPESPKQLIGFASPGGGDVHGWLGSSLRSAVKNGRFDTCEALSEAMKMLGQPESVLYLYTTSDVGERLDDIGVWFDGKRCGPWAARVLREQGSRYKCDDNCPFHKGGFWPGAVKALKATKADGGVIDVDPLPQEEAMKSAQISAERIDDSRRWIATADMDGGGRVVLPCLSAAGDPKPALQQLDWPRLYAEGKSQLVRQGADADAPHVVVYMDRAAVVGEDGTAIVERLT